MPAEKVFYQQISDDPKLRWASYPPVMEDLKAKARELGLWNLWLSGGEFQHLAKGSGGGLSNLEYGVIAEITGYASHTAPEAMNCSAPDTGNMEVIARFGSDAQKERYLIPLVNGKIRSAFSMTEYGVASSDASNLRNTTAVMKNGKLILNGHKWVSSSACACGSRVPGFGGFGVLPSPTHIPHHAPRMASCTSTVHRASENGQQLWTVLCLRERVAHVHELHMCCYTVLPT